MNEKEDYVILCVVVDDIAFDANKSHLGIDFKKKIKMALNVKLNGMSASFIRRTIIRPEKRIYAHQQKHVDSLHNLVSFTLCNTTHFPLSTIANFEAHLPTKLPLYKPAYHLCRSTIGGIVYLATLTRPDPTFILYTLSRSPHATSSNILNFLSDFTATGPEQKPTGLPSLPELFLLSAVFTALLMPTGVLAKARFNLRPALCSVSIAHHFFGKQIVKP